MKHPNKRSHVRPFIESSGLQALVAVPNDFLEFCDDRRTACCTREIWTLGSTWLLASRLHESDAGMLIAFDAWRFIQDLPLQKKSCANKSGAGPMIYVFAAVPAVLPDLRAGPVPQHNAHITRIYRQEIFRFDFRLSRSRPFYEFRTGASQIFDAIF